MTPETFESDPTERAAARATDDRIRREALRQIESVDLDDDDWRIEPLPEFEGEPLELDAKATQGRPSSETSD